MIDLTKPIRVKNHPTDEVNVLATFSQFGEDFAVISFDGLMSRIYSLKVLNGFCENIPEPEPELYVNVFNDRPEVSGFYRTYDEAKDALKKEGSLETYVGTYKLVKVEP